MLASDAFGAARRSRLSQVARAMCRRPGARVAIAAWLLLASTADAAPSPSRPRLEVVRERGAEACATEAELARAVEERLGYAPFDDHAVEVLRVTMRPRGAELTAHIERVDAAGNVAGALDIASHGADCKELSASTAVAIAIALDPRPAE
ncbi:MAG TPA: hypothetical protein VHB21_15060, partial [Minicystis sp.]|nr:hypothetical protein [Minicystis sp.]